MPDYTNKKKNKKTKTEYTKADKQHIVLIVVMAIVALVLLVKGVSAFNDDGTDVTNISVSEDTTVVTTTQTTTAPTTPPTTTDTVKPTEQIKDDKTENTDKTEPSKENTDKAESKEEILKKVTDGINSLKASDASYVGNKNQYIDIRVTDCSVPQVTGIINNVLELFMGEEIYEYDFTNGVADDPEEGGQTTPDAVIPPSFNPFTLTIDGVEDAYVEKDGDNTIYTITIIPEESTMNEKPFHHSKAVDVIELDSLDIPAKITRADYKYSGTKISVTYDASGKVIRYHQYFDMYGVGEGGAMGITATCTMEGYIDETWDIHWK